MKHPKYEGFVIVAHCSQCKRPYGITVAKQGKDYLFKWSFKLTDKAAKSEGFDQNKVSGNIFNSTGFPGCSHCSNHSWVQCGGCGSFSCYAGEGRFKCPVCGNEGEVTTSDNFDLKGGGY